MRRGARPSATQQTCPYPPPQQKPGGKCGLGDPALAASARVLVACIGNGLVADDAAGPAVYERLVRSPVCGGIRVELLAVGGLSLLDLLRGEKTLLVVDAVRLGASPGTVHVLEWENIPGAPGLPVTGHGIGVREAIDIGRLIGDGRVPDRVILVGIEGVCFDGIGRPMTPAVAAAVEPAAERVTRLALSLSSEGCLAGPVEAETAFDELK